MPETTPQTGTQSTSNAQITKESEALWATGRRKTSIARVKTVNGSGKIKVNSKELDKYFVMEKHRAEIMKPFNIILDSKKYDYAVNVTGGGLSGQAEAVRHAISRVLLKVNSTFRAKLKDAGLLTRDPREVERKKPGQPKARKKFQWTKR